MELSVQRTLNTILPANPEKSLNENSMSMKLNKEWHHQNQMPKNPDFEQRLAWHLDHLNNCGCRKDLPLKLKEEMAKRHISIPTI